MTSHDKDGRMVSFSGTKADWIQMKLDQLPKDLSVYEVAKKKVILDMEATLLFGGENHTTSRRKS